MEEEEEEGWRGLLRGSVSRLTGLGIVGEFVGLATRYTGDPGDF